MSGREREHRHCLWCGRMIPPDRRFCSPRCEEEYLRRQREAESLRRWIMLISTLLLMLTLINLAVLLLS